ncbi:hypothetical protein SAMN06296952_0029 [Oscillospiraceae bacterium]|nr:hypothetical protein SAMN06296952_0029 [Oscillospiraceae bacterium]
MADKMDIAFREELLAGLKTESDLSELAVKYKDLGMDNESMYHNLEVLRQEMRAKEDEASEDLIMDLMDRVVGWCHTDCRIYPDP